MSALIVKACGPALSIQDRGRFGLQRFGVSPAGAMDVYFLAAANVLAGAPPEAAAIELGPGLARFVAQGELTIAATGPDCSLSVADQVVPASTAAQVRDGEAVTLRVGSRAAYAYLALSGGVASPPDMGSRAMHRRSGIGGAALAAGSVIPAGRDGTGLTPHRFATEPAHEGGPIRIIPGPQEDYFAPEALALLVETAFGIGLQADRMGVRLEGPTLPHLRGYNIVSDGIVDGAIQVPGDGHPIVLLRDRQTTGGYPKIATIISADIGRFAQIPPGGSVRFAIVTMEQAVAAARRLQEALAALPGSLVPAQAALTSERLLSLNLVSGVTNATAPALEGA